MQLSLTTANLSTVLFLFFTVGAQAAIRAPSSNSTLATTTMSPQQYASWYNNLPYCDEMTEEANVGSTSTSSFGLASATSKATATAGSNGPVKSVTASSPTTSSNAPAAPNNNKVVSHGMGFVSTEIIFFSGIFLLLPVLF